jgi:hypothetical protein
VSVAALLSGVLAAAAAQALAADSVLRPAQPDRSPAFVGNPLWAIPVSELAQTGARPLFSPSRRPPTPPTLAALPSPPTKPGPPSKTEPDHPLLTLLGTIVSASVELGVFVDEASHDVIRLKIGEVHDGWTLRSVLGRAAIFQKQGYRAATLALPAPGAEPRAANGHTAPPVIHPVAIQGTGQTTGVSPANTFEPAGNPAATKGGSRRPPKEG